jgi:membrane-associated protein
MLEQVLDIMNNLDTHLASFTTEHGVWVYVLLFAIIFAETGLVFMPFLPGDSLLFTVGALAARPEMNLSFWLLFAALVVAAIIGDAVNYHVGRYLGPKVFTKDADDTWLEKALNRKHLERANSFYVKYGGKAVVLGRFVPIVRTFVPFVAGAGAMDYRRFVIFNVAGALLWVGACMAAGWFFGNVPWVKRNFEAVVVGIIVVSLIPVAVEVVLSRRGPKSAAAPAVNSEVL